jgi:hypothetical protein
VNCWLKILPSEGVGNAVWFIFKESTALGKGHQMMAFSIVVFLFSISLLPFVSLQRVSACGPNNAIRLTEVESFRLLINEADHYRFEDDLGTMDGKKQFSKILEL